MTPRAKRRWLDSAIGLTVLIGLGVTTTWWVPLVVSAFGMWNYYDGMTRMDLPDK